MIYCGATDIGNYILQAYLDAVEEQTPGGVGRHIAGVSAEIDEAILQGGYKIQEGVTSATLTRICAVIAGWRSVAGVTSLMSSEASSSNEWLPLQQSKNSAEKDLVRIREGKLDPYPSSTDQGGISVSTGQAMFPRKIWEMF